MNPSLRPARAALPAAAFALFAASGAAAAPPRAVVQEGHGAEVIAVAFSRDGRLLFTAGRDAAAKAWDLATGDEAASFLGHLGPISGLAVGADGKTLATASLDGTAALWDLADPGAPPRLFDARPGQALCAALSPDGRVLAAGISDGTVRAWDTTSGSELRSFEGHALPVLAIAISPDGRTLATGGADGTLRLWDMESGAALRGIKHGSWVQSLAFSADGLRLAAGCANGETRLWNPATGAALRAFGNTRAAGRTAVASVSFSRDGRWLATAGAGCRAGKDCLDRAARLWDVATGAEVRSFEGHAAAVEAAAISPDGRWLATAGDDKTARLWDLATGKAVRTLQGRPAGYSALALLPGGDRLAAGRVDGRIELWDLKAGLPVMGLPSRPGPVLALAAAADGKTAASADADGRVRLWDLSSGEAGKALDTAPQAAAPLALSADGGFLAAGGDCMAGKTCGDASLRLWQLPSGAAPRVLKGPERAGAVAFSPDGAALVAGYNDGTVALWDTRTALELKTLQSPAGLGEGAIRAAAFTPDNRQVAAAGDDKTARLWDAGTGRLAGEFRHEAGLRCLSVSPDGYYLATGDRDGRITLWALASGERLWEAPAHQAGVARLAVSPDGRHLFSVGADRRLVVRSMESGEELLSLLPAADGWAALSPGGFFDGSPAGIEAVRLSAGLKPHPLEAFSERYRVPGLAGRVLAGESFASSEVPGLSRGFRPPPIARIATPSPGARAGAETVEVKVEVLDQGGGIDEVRLFVNGKIVPGEAKALEAAPAKGRAPAGRRSLYSFEAGLSPGRNRLRAAALSRDRIESRPHEIEVLREGAPAPGALRVLAVGISRYKNPDLSLNFARPDAEAILKHFETAPSGPFREVLPRALLDEAATREAILAGLAGLRAAAPGDTVVVFLAGRGESAEGGWFFVPHELTQAKRPQDLKAGAVSLSELGAALRASPAQRILLVLDGYEAGLGAPGVEERKGLLGLARSTGARALAASSADRLEPEVRELGRGAFAHAVLEGLQGAADAEPKDAVVTARELLGFVEGRLPALTARRGARARRAFNPGPEAGADFPLTGVK